VLYTKTMTSFKKLFIPGPTQVHPDVLAKMATPMMGHRGKEATELQRNISEKMQQVMFTKNKIILSTSSGTGLMEGAIRSATAKRAIVFSVGAFGDRWADLARLNNIPYDLHQEIAGNPTMAATVDKYLSTGKYDVLTITHNETSSGIMNPVAEIAEVVKKYPYVLWLMDTVSSMAGTKIEVDKLGVDICITSTQKALALPPGMAIAAISPKAEARFNEIGPRGYYLDLKTLVKYVDQSDYQYHATPSLSHMFALDFQLDRILTEGLESRFARHREMRNFMLNWSNKYFKQFAKKSYESDTLTVIDNTRNISVSDLNKELGKRGMIIANGYGELKEKTFRIAHMGELTMADMQEVTGAIQEILSL
jgi:aspartate aminotransferase-like enzyme